MPDRYTTRPNGWMDERGNYIPMPSITVTENRDPVPTGLLNQHGERIYRVPETVPMGFQAPVKGAGHAR